MHVTPDAQRLRVWVDRLLRHVSRTAERPIPAVLPSGRRVYGIPLSPELVLGRDQQFYLLTLGYAQPVTLDQVVRMLPSHLIRARYDAAVRISRPRSDARRQRKGKRLPRRADDP